MGEMLRRFGFTYMLDGANDGGSGGGGGSGDGGQGGGEGAGAGGQGTGDGSNDPLASLTAEQRTAMQAELNRVGAQQKAEGRRSAAQALADDLGCTVDEAKQIIADKRTADDNAKSEADRIKDAAQRDRDAAAKALADAALVSVGAQVTAALIGAGVTDPDPKMQAQKHSEIGRLVVIPGDTAPEDVPTAIAAAVADLRTRYPAMFTPAPPGAGGAPSHGGGGKPPPGGAQGTGALSRGAQRAKDEADQKRPTFQEAPSTNPLEHLTRR